MGKIPPMPSTSDEQKYLWEPIATSTDGLDRSRRDRFFLKARGPVHSMKPRMVCGVTMAYSENAG